MMGIFCILCRKIMNIKVNITSTGIYLMYRKDIIKQILWENLKVVYVFNNKNIFFLEKHEPENVVLCNQFEYIRFELTKKSIKKLLPFVNKYKEKIYNKNSINPILLKNLCGA